MGGFCDLLWEATIFSELVYAVASLTFIYKSMKEHPYIFLNSLYSNGHMLRMSKNRIEHSGLHNAA